MRDGILVTGGAGFIGSNFILYWNETVASSVVNLDLLTYAANPANLASLRGNPAYEFVQGDIGNASLVAALLAQHRPRAIVHFAAESHVDRSIAAPEPFLQTNVQGSFHLLQQARIYWSSLSPADQSRFRFLHVSTDEVYGSLAPADPPSSERSPYAPNSPYAASKAAADHFARAFHHTWGLPVVTTHFSNNYGPFQFPEKLIPLTILNALEGKPLPVYGDGLHVRDWLYVRDTCAALGNLLNHGRPGETYNLGGNTPRTNLEVVTLVCALVDELSPSPAIGPRNKLITFVNDRPGHDRRYALDNTKISAELGWNPATRFEDGLRQTVRWYIESPAWIQSVRTAAYRDWIHQNYTRRPKA